MSKRPDRPPDGYPKHTPRGDALNWTRTSTLLRYCNPFEQCWADLPTPLTFEDVQQALQRKRLTLGEPYDLPEAAVLSETEARTLHARKVAWFVRHGFQEPLELDVGVPEWHCYVTHFIQDGNHRFAAAVYRHRTMGEDPWLPLLVSGSVDYMKELGLR